MPSKDLFGRQCDNSLRGGHETNGYLIITWWYGNWEHYVGHQIPWWYSRTGHWSSTSVYQHVFARTIVCSLGEGRCLLSVNHKLGRTVMHLQILVMGVMKQGLGC